MLYKHCSAVAKTLVSYQGYLTIDIKPSTIWAAVKEINSIPVYHDMVNLKIHFVSASVS